MDPHDAPLPHPHLRSGVAVKITLFAPCFVDGLYPDVGKGVVAVLERLGHEVVFPPAQTCCGQPAFNTGYWREARAMAGHFLDVFSDAEIIVCPSGSCVSMVRTHYPELFAGGARERQAGEVASRTFELTELLADRLGVTDVGARFAAKVTWHDGCHALRDLGVRSAPRRLLGAVKDLQLVEAPGESCCGFGGTFAVKFPHISTGMDENKVEALLGTGAAYVASADSTCLMQIGGLLARRSAAMKTIHIAEILASC